MKDKIVWMAVLAIVGCSAPAREPNTVAPPAEAMAPAPSATDEKGCPADVMTAEGKPCSVPNQWCGATNNTGFSNKIHCANGKWEHIEAPPPPH